MKKITFILIISAVILLFSGCASYYNNLVFENIVLGFEEGMENEDADKLIILFEDEVTVSVNGDSEVYGQTLLKSFFEDFFLSAKLNSITIEKISEDENNGSFSFMASYIKVIDDSEVQIQFNLYAKKGFFWFIDRMNLLHN